MDLGKVTGIDEMIFKFKPALHQIPCSFWLQAIDMVNGVDSF